MSRQIALPKATRDSFVVQANSLARGRFDSSPSIHGIRLLEVAFSKIDRGSDLLNQVTISPAELRDIFPSYARSKGLGRYLDEATDQIMRLRGEAYLGPDEWRKINLVSSAHYSGKRHGIKIEFHPEMREFLLSLKGSFTRYQLSNVANLSTSYRYMLYKFLRSYAHHRGVAVSLEELRSRLAVKPHEYESTRDLMKRVIKPALEEINNSTDLAVTFDPLKEGRTYVGLQFTITTKAGSELSQFTTAMITLLKAAGVDSSQAQTLGSSTPLLEAVGAVAYAEYQSVKGAQAGREPIVNKGGYIVSCLRSRVAFPEDDALYAQCLLRVKDEYRHTVYLGMEPSEQDSLRDSFANTLQGKLRADWDRFGSPQTADLRAAFTKHLRAIIRPDAPKAVMSIA